MALPPTLLYEPPVVLVLEVSARDLTNGEPRGRNIDDAARYIRNR